MVKHMYNVLNIDKPTVLNIVKFSQFVLLPTVDSAAHLLSTLLTLCMGLVLSWF